MRLNVRACSPIRFVKGKKMFLTVSFCQGGFVFSITAHLHFNGCRHRAAFTGSSLPLSSGSAGRLDNGWNSNITDVHKAHGRYPLCNRSLTCICSDSAADMLSCSQRLWLYESAVGSGSLVHMLLLNCKKTQYSMLERWWITHLLIIADWLWCPTSNIGSCSSLRIKKKGFLIISTNIAHGSSTSLDIYHMFAQLERTSAIKHPLLELLPRVNYCFCGDFEPHDRAETNVSRYDKVTKWSVVLIKRFWHMFNDCMKQRQKTSEMIDVCLLWRLFLHVTSGVLSKVTGKKMQTMMDEGQNGSTLACRWLTCST